MRPMEILLLLAGLLWICFLVQDRDALAQKTTLPIWLHNEAEEKQLTVEPVRLWERAVTL